MDVESYKKYVRMVKRHNKLYEPRHIMTYAEFVYNRMLLFENCEKLKASSSQTS